MARESVVGNQILACFKNPGDRLTLVSIGALLPELTHDSLKGALDRLRGGDGAEKRLKVVGYLKQQGNGGKPMPIFEVGSEPDVPRSDEYIEDPAAETARRARDVRRMQEERRLQKELDAIDNYS